LIADKKKRITLQNMKMLIDFGLIPEEYDLQCRVYNFNKYLKKFKFGNSYGLDDIALGFYSYNFDMDLLMVSSEPQYIFQIKQTDWDKIYKKQMDIIRPFIQKNNEELLNKVNNRLRQDLWDKYCLGNISQWEMDSISCYIHDHELKKLKNSLYGISSFNKLPNEPIVDYTFPSKDGRRIPMFKICRIAGTVLDRDKNKKTVTLLTNDSVVTVKIFGDAFTHYDKQISIRRADGTKKVVEKSYFSRGNKIIVTGIKKDETNFLAKKYSKTPYSLVEKITYIREDGTIETTSERAEAE